jgi:hypothetical protein
LVPFGWTVKWPPAACILVPFRLFETGIHVWALAEAVDLLGADEVVELLHGRERLDRLGVVEVVLQVRLVEVVDAVRGGPEVDARGDRVHRVEAEHAQVLGLVKLVSLVCHSYSSSKVVGALSALSPAFWISSSFQPRPQITNASIAGTP